MKKCLVVLSVIVFALAFVASDLMAFQEAFNASGHRTQSRNAAAGTIDAAYYNPAGLVTLKEGLYVDAGNRILSLTTKTKIVSGSTVGFNGAESESATLTYLLPNLALAYRVGAGAVFYTLDIREGGAGGEWDSANSFKALGLYHPTNGAMVTKVEGTTYTLGQTLGVSYALNNMVAVSGGLRYLWKNSESKMSLTTYGSAVANASDDVFKEETTTAEGYTAFVGAMVTPMQGLNIAIQFQGRTIKVGETEQTDPNGVSATGSETALSISPSVLYFGVGYTAMPGLEVMFSYTTEFTAEQGYSANQAGMYIFPKKDKNKQVFGLGAEYTVAPGILVSAGFAYKLTETDDVNNTDPTDPSFDEMDIGFGGVYTVMPGLNIEVGFAYNIYSESTSSIAFTGTELNNGKIAHNRDAWVIGFGVSYKVL